MVLRSSSFNWNCDWLSHLCFLYLLFSYFEIPIIIRYKLKKCLIGKWDQGSGEQSDHQKDNKLI
jgi:hypothetical protein